MNTLNAYIDNAYSADSWWKAIAAAVTNRDRHFRCFSVCLLACVKCQARLCP